MKNCVPAILTMAVLAAGATAEGQQVERRPSPAGASATQIGGDTFDGRMGNVGGKWVEITYGRPIKRGRDLFDADDFVEFLNDGGPVWRAGANVSTQLSSELPLRLGGVVVPPGVYTIFIELARDRWTLIVSTFRALTGGSDTADPKAAPAIYGAFDYTPDRDLVRVPMTVETLPYSHDQLHWQFLDVTRTGGRLAIFWDNRMASVPFAVAD
jgi:hypothetical protein